MKWNEFVISTFREEPKEAESKSHKLLLRGGYIHKLFSGIYLYTPLGWKVLHKITNIVREEMNKAGALEVLLSVLQPDTIWKETGRYEAYGPAMYKLNDRTDKMLVIGPTHEEPITILAKSILKSYRDLPKTLYQIQVKFRDELRPRFGPIRAREFIMKDAYSFDLDEHGLNKSYETMSIAYHAIFKRLQLNYLCVEAESGLMGGNESQEFISLSEYGEDTVVRCLSCGYLANVQVAKSFPNIKNANDKGGEIEFVYTPNVRTLSDVCNFLKVKPAEVIKTLIFTNQDNKIFAFCVRGDYELNLTKAQSVAKSTQLNPAGKEVIEKLTGAEVGFSGPYGLSLSVFVDQNLIDGNFYVVGSNRTNYHIKNFNVKRDLQNYVSCDLNVTKEGDLCLKCKTTLEFLKGIEVGHIFKLGTKYTETFKFKVSTQDGKLSTVIMGCYGIGISRLMSAILESTSTDEAIYWPAEVAPFAIEIISINANAPDELKVSEELHNELVNRGYEVIWDNRKESAGVKFNDADLIGAPVNIIVGKSYKESKKVEIKNRIKKEATLVKKSEVLQYVDEFFNKRK